MMQTVSRLRTVSETPFSTSSRPKRLWTSTASMTASLIGARTLPPAPRRPAGARGS